MIRSKWGRAALLELNLVSISRIMSANKILKSPFPDVSIPDGVSLSQVILEKMAKHDKSIALIDDATGRKMSYAELRQTICLVAGKLLERGIRKGDVIFVCAPNCVEYPIVFLAGIHVGAIVTTCNPAYTEGGGDFCNQIY